MNKINLSEELRSIAAGLTVLTNNEKTQILNFLIENQNLFIEKPIGARSFEYKIKLKKEMNETGIIVQASGSICNPIR